MGTSGIRWLGLFAVLAVASTRALGEPAAGFEAAYAEAKRNERSEAGKPYVEALLRKQGKLIQGAMGLCFKETRSTPEKLEAFALVAKLGYAGKVEQSAVEPNTQFALCFERNAARIPFDPPPSPDFWIVFEMNFSG